MTDKKEKKPDQKESNKKAPAENISTVNNSNKSDIKSETENIESTLKKEETEKKLELLEEKEGAGLQLEYFSKEILIQKITDLESSIKEKDNKIKELNGWKDKYVRLQAEFDNTQKRWEKNRQYLKGQYTAETLRNFLPLYDSFKKALESSKDNNQLSQFYNQFMSILKFLGAEPIKTQISDMFDYNIHEAVASIEKENIPENSIIDIIQEGWKYNKDVLRYTKVVISKKPKPPEIKVKKEEKPEAAKISEKEEEVIDSSISQEKTTKEHSRKQDKSPSKDNDSSASDKNDYVT